MPKDMLSRGFMKIMTQGLNDFEADAQRHAQGRQQARQLNHHIALIAKDNEINVALAMASMGAPGNRNPLDVVNNAPYCLKIHGQYHHLTSTAMRPADGQAPRFAQLYFLDTEEAVNHRMNKKANQECDFEIMKNLSSFMVQCNEFAKTFKMMRQVEQDLNPIGNKNINLMLSFRNDPQHDQRKYNAPQANEIAVVFQNVDGFKVTQMDYYAHLLAPRAEFSQFKRAGKLRCQFILDAYMKTEANRLNYIKLNQPQLRAELYSGLMDHLDNRAQNEGITVGVPVILPSSFMGSPRNMQERYQDVFAYAGVIEFQKRGLPHLHLLAMLSDEDKPRLQEVIDMMVWAEIPNEEKYSELNEKVLKHMIHGPCGDPSRRYPCTGDDGKCSKGFPKEFSDKTNANDAAIAKNLVETDDFWEKRWRKQQNRICLHNFENYLLTFASLEIQ
ncbi:uncharacterized protein LOC114943640 [Nylanderia fulva]|uniref:uncharacterized protein LOC114943640 n=1 Tax=Nylanderia fulva TaxID=613905 RepID=UPI0010FB51AB|nr:uncharacterized protein LOC114943640 [Nylanderia fulva]